MAKRRRFTAKFKAEVALESLSGEAHRRNCVADTTFPGQNFSPDES